MSTNEWTRVGRGIYRHADGRIKLRIHSPRQTERTLPAGTALPQARLALKALRAELAAALEEAAAAEQNDPTLKKYAEDWLVAQKKHLRASTYGTYKAALDAQVLPRIGELRCSLITRADVQAMVDAFDAARKPDGSAYSYQTARGWWRVGKQMLKDMAADHGRDDPTRRIKPPRRREGGRARETRTLTAAELGSLVDAAQQFVPDRHAEIAMLAYSGVRAGELYALCFDDIDAEQRTVHVRRSFARGQLNRTKTGDARVVVVPARVIKAVEAHRERMNASDHPGLASGLVFPSNLGTHRIANSLRKPLALLEERLRLDVHLSPQVLRRTYNTLLMAAGVDRIVLRAMMGHASEAMTNRYSGIGLDLKAHAASTLEQMVAGEGKR